MVLVKKILRVPRRQILAAGDSHLRTGIRFVDLLAPGILVLAFGIKRGQSFLPTVFRRSLDP